jgi:predicted transcriptional regulator
MIEKIKSEDITDLYDVASMSVKKINEIIDALNKNEIDNKFNGDKFVEELTKLTQTNIG